MGLGLRRTIAGLAFITVAVLVILGWVQARGSQDNRSGFVPQPVSTQVPSPKAVVSPTPVFEDRIRALVAAIEAGDPDTLFAALRRYYLCGMLDEVPRCSEGSGEEVVAQIGLHIYPTYRHPGQMYAWLESFMSGNRHRLVLLAEAPATDFRPVEALLLLFEADEPRSPSPGTQRFDGIGVSVIRDSSIVAELDFYCVERAGCGRDFSDNASEIERLARGKIDPEYCDVSYEPICADLRRSFGPANQAR
jgi:hypothetical protein